MRARRVWGDGDVAGRDGGVAAYVSTKARGAFAARARGGINSELIPTLTGKIIAAVNVSSIYKVVERAHKAR